MVYGEAKAPPGTVHVLAIPGDGACRKVGLQLLSAVWRVLPGDKGTPVRRCY
ncbi:hypothetical protein E2C01_025658 [Portunus trituberculatus]|uniref:Uncharacterized protein n=1 Tax=Portunus trituberculatus TaxID=210409 RepID=A0A5B7EG09_PORTR|nr:hypothetical protein [Portunus trituberculatus]